MCRRHVLHQRSDETYMIDCVFRSQARLSKYAVLCVIQYHATVVATNTLIGFYKATTHKVTKQKYKA